MDVVETQPRAERSTKILRRIFLGHRLVAPPSFKIILPFHSGDPKIDEGEIAPALKVKVLILLLLFNREQIAEAQHHGEKCAKLRIIELMESQACNIECKSPGKEISFSLDIPRLVDGTDKLVFS